MHFKLGTESPLKEFRKILSMDLFLSDRPALIFENQLQSALFINCPKEIEACTHIALKIYFINATKQLVPARVQVS